MAEWGISPRAEGMSPTLWRHGPRGEFPCTVIRDGDLPKIAVTVLAALPEDDRLRAVAEVPEVRALVEAARLGEDCAHDMDFFCDRASLAKSGAEAFEKIQAALARWREVLPRG